LTLQDRFPEAASPWWTISGRVISGIFGVTAAISWRRTCRGYRHAQFRDTQFDAIFHEVSITTRRSTTSFAA
jgi:hypothetical protein